LLSARAAEPHRTRAELGTQNCHKFNNMKTHGGNATLA
jgi:hypothetical protein